MRLYDWLVVAFVVGILALGMYGMIQIGRCSDLCEEAGMLRLRTGLDGTCGCVEGKTLEMGDKDG